MYVTPGNLLHYGTILPLTELRLVFGPHATESLAKKLEAQGKLTIHRPTPRKTFVIAGAFCEALGLPKLPTLGAPEPLAQVPASLAPRRGRPPNPVDANAIKRPPGRPRKYPRPGEALPAVAQLSRR